MPRSILKKEKTEIKKKQEKKLQSENNRVYKTPRIMCEDCKKVLSIDKYYKDSCNPTGYYRVCKDCMCERAIDKKNNQLTKVGLTGLLQIINKPYVHEFWKNIKIKDSKPEQKLGSYIRMLNMNNYANKFFKDSDIEWSVDETDEEKNEAKIYNDVWAGEYTHREITILNKLLDSYQKDFSITDASQLDYTRKICKASLELDECTDGLRKGTISEQRYKLARETFDTLSKSAKFAKSSQGNDNALGCFGQIFDLVEKNAWVEPYVPESEDVYDKLITQLSNIERSL